MRKRFIVVPSLFVLGVVGLNILAFYRYERLEVGAPVSPGSVLEDEDLIAGPASPSQALSHRYLPAWISELIFGVESPRRDLEEPKSAASPRLALDDPIGRVVIPNDGLDPAPRDCAASLTPPTYSVRVEITRFRQTSEFHRCSTAAELLLAEMKDKPGEESLFWSKSYLAEKKHLYDRVKNYADACLTRLDSDAHSGLLSEKQLAIILSQIGVLSEGKRNYCVGMIHGKKVLTARHCFANLDSGNAWGEIRDPGTSHKFSTFAGAQFDLSVSDDGRTAFFEPLSRDRLDRDYIVLEASPSSADTVYPENLISQDEWLGQQWQQLLLVSVQPYLEAVADQTQPTLVATPSLDVSPLCRVFIREGDFLLHACQTEAGMSGTPLLAIGQDESVNIVGLHTGETRLLEGPCAMKYKENYPNYGIALPRLEEIMK